MTRTLARLIVVLGVAVAVTACLGPQLEVRIENDSEATVVIELTGGGQHERTEVLAGGGVEFQTVEQGAWTLAVNGQPVADSTTFPRSEGPILFVHVDPDGDVQVARAAEA